MWPSPAGGEGIDGGRTYLLVVTSAEPARAYIVTKDKKTAAWVCTCFVNRWQRRCAHLEAVEAWAEVTPLGQEAAGAGGDRDQDDRQEHRDDGEQDPGQEPALVHTASVAQGQEPGA